MDISTIDHFTVNTDSCLHNVLKCYKLCSIVLFGGHVRGVSKTRNTEYGIRNTEHGIRNKESADYRDKTGYSFFLSR